MLRHSSCENPSDVHIDHCFTTLTEAIRYAPQAAVIANPTSHHLAVALPLARAGVHLLVEKPIAANPVGVEELITACHTQNCVLMTAYNLRFLPSLQHFSAALDQGLIGRVFSVRAEVGQYLPDWRSGTDYRTAVSAKAALGGGVLLELSHELDYLRWLFGEVQWVSAFLGRLSDLEIDVEDTAFLTLGFSGKNQGKSVTISLNMDFVRKDSTRSCVVIGEHGTLRWNALLGTVEVFRKGAASWETLFSKIPQSDDSYMAEWRHFVDCVEWGKPPMISGQDGLAVVKIIQAARLSSERRAVVKIA